MLGPNAPHPLVESNPNQRPATEEYRRQQGLHTLLFREELDEPFHAGGPSPRIALPEEGVELRVGERFNESAGDTFVADE